MSDGEDTPEKHRSLAPAWQPGQSGNPMGRPKGARNKLGEEFVQALYASFQEHGAETLETVRTEDPTQYVKVVASLLPKELNVKVSELDELSDEQIARQLATVARQLTAAGFDLGAGTGAETVAQQAGGVPTLQ